MSHTPVILILGDQGQLGRSLWAAPQPLGLGLAGRDLEQVDITDPSRVESALDETGCALVVNAAAYTAVDRAESEPQAAHAVNEAGAGNVARACAKHGLPLIHLSTDYVFDGALDRPYRPDDPPNPLSVYGASKLAGERAVARANPRSMILRTAWLFSQYGTNFVKTMLRLGQERGAVSVVDDQVGCPTGAAGLAEVVLSMAAALLEGKDDGFGLFHYCGAEPISWCGLAREVFAAADMAVEVEPIASAALNQPAQRPAWSALDCSRTTGVYGIMAQDWRAELAAVVAALG